MLLIFRRSAAILRHKNAHQRSMPIAPRRRPCKLHESPTITDSLRSADGNGGTIEAKIVAPNFKLEPPVVEARWSRAPSQAGMSEREEMDRGRAKHRQSGRSALRATQKCSRLPAPSRVARCWLHGEAAGWLRLSERARRIQRGFHLVPFSRVYFVWIGAACQTKASADPRDGEATNLRNLPKL